MSPDHQIWGYTVFRQAQMVLVVEGNHLYILFVWSFRPLICNGNPGILFTPGLSSWGDGTSLIADYRYLGVPPHKLTRGLHHWFHLNILAWRAAQQQGLEWHHGIATPLPEAYGPMGWTGTTVADPLAGIAPCIWLSTNTSQLLSGMMPEVGLNADSWSIIHSLNGFGG